MKKVPPLLPHQSLDGWGLDFLESLSAENMRRERLTLKGLFWEMRESGFSLQNYLHDNKTLIEDIGREDEFLVGALVDMNEEKHLTEKDAYTILGALFEVDEQDPWPSKKATRFIDLLVQMTAAGTKQMPKSPFLGGNFTVASSQMHLASLTLNGAPNFLISLLEQVLPIQSKDTSQVCEMLAGKYAMNFSFAFVPILCDLFGRDPKITHMAWSLLSKKPEDHQQWKEAVDELSAVAKSYGDKKVLETALIDTVSQKTEHAKLSKL